MPADADYQQDSPGDSEASQSLRNTGFVDAKLNYKKGKSLPLSFHEFL